MANPINKIIWQFIGDTKSLEKGNKKAQSSFKATSKAGDAMSGALGLATKAAGALGVALGAREFVNFAGDAIQMAIAADEVDSKFEAVYGTAEEFTAALKDWSDMAGITDTAAKDMAATFGNLAIAQGVSADDTEELALAVAGLAGDMASFNDVDPATVFEDLNKALLTTEREGMKKYGIAVTEAEVKSRAMAIAVADGRSEVTQADRAMASYEIVVQQAGKAVGDLERTQDSLANKQRRLKATWKEMQEAFGKELVGALEEAIDTMGDAELELEELGATAGRVAVSGLRPFIDALGDAAVAADTSIPIWDRLTASWRSGFSIMSDIVPPVILANKALDTLRGTTERLTGGADRLAASFDSFPYLQFQQGMNAWRDAANGAAGAVAGLSREITQIPSLADLEAPTSARPGGGSGTALRAAGGPVSAGVPYTVGEAGRETFVPNRAGTVVPGSVGGGGGVTVNLYGFVGDAVALSQQLNDLLELGGRNGG